jgi:hypothetical protein
MMDSFKSLSGWWVETNKLGAGLAMQPREIDDDSRNHVLSACGT